MMKIQAELDRSKNNQNDLKNKNEMTVEVVDKLQNENQELKNETNELMMKQRDQQLETKELAGKGKSLFETKCSCSFFFFLLFRHFYIIINQPISGRVDRASATETVDFGRFRVGSNQSL